MTKEEAAQNYIESKSPELKDERVDYHPIVEEFLTECTMD